MMGNTASTSVLTWERLWTIVDDFEQRFPPPPRVIVGSPFVAYDKALSLGPGELLLLGKGVWRRIYDLAEKQESPMFGGLRIENYEKKLLVLALAKALLGFRPNLPKLQVNTGDWTDDF